MDKKIRTEITIDNGTFRANCTLPDNVAMDDSAIYIMQSEQGDNNNDEVLTVLAKDIEGLVKLLTEIHQTINHRDWSSF